MDDINTEFDNLSGLSDVKDFDQSNDPEVSIFDIPVVYQEFDHIENEIDNSAHKLNELDSYATRLQDAQVVRRDDVLALESIIGELKALPHINSYTDEYSFVNYQVTQESVFGKIREVVGSTLKWVWEFILKSLEFVTKHLKALFHPVKYKNTPKERTKTKHKQAKAQEATQKVTQVVKQKTQQATPEANTQRVNRINKKLRDLLYPAFTELEVLSQGGDINPDLLIDEMCEQRFAAFYTTFFKAIYENDFVLSDFIKLYGGMLNNDVTHLARRTEGFEQNDLTAPLSEAYIPHYTRAPEQLKVYLEKYAGSELPQGQIKDDAREFRTLATIAHATASDMVSIKLTHDLPEPRTLLKLDLDWLAILDSVTMKTVDNIESNYARLKKIKAKAYVKYPDVHPDNKASVTDLYNDWLVLNKAMLTSSLFLARLNAISKNYSTLMDYIIGASVILTE